MESILETQRRMHEEIERLEQAITDELAQRAKTHRDKMLQDHRVKKYLVRIKDRSKALLELYADDDGQRKGEIRAISGATEFTEFYQRLRDIKEHHRRFPNEVLEVMELELTASAPEEEEAELEKTFTGEEAFGKYLDLHAQHELFLNLGSAAEDRANEGDRPRRLTYLEYLSEFDKLDGLPRALKQKAAYERYVTSLRKYLEDWFDRAQPLFDLVALQRNVEVTFDGLWATGSVPGWSVAQGDSEGVFCDACQREFAKQSVYDAHLSGKKHIKAASAMATKPAADSTSPSLASKDSRAQKDRALALQEAFIAAYGFELTSIKEDTRMNVERKQALTDKERLEDVQDIEVEEEVEEEEEQIYNPLKLPLGWDGKPIPYWLYKLHGLGVEYPCEICGNFVYMGRKAFDRHFQEARHAHAMRALGIPNSRHFHDITLIEDAYARKLDPKLRLERLMTATPVWEKLKSKSKTEDFRPDVMEEYEDQDGNVFNKKTWVIPLSIQRQVSLTVKQLRRSSPAGTAVLAPPLTDHRRASTSSTTSCLWITWRWYRQRFQPPTETTPNVAKNRLPTLTAGAPRRCDTMATAAADPIPSSSDVLAHGKRAM
ncbi:hypothetical protein DFJ74DRAFT_668466 [Hyaloraphidium curvatum]|nr:hypothetical protein DFJ74DRAFT_668466 [Hyaloraphidium curvatum]